MAKKMTMKKYEGSKADKAVDKKKGLKEGSKADNKLDRGAVKKANAFGKKK
jgi:hypothetical protein